MAGCGGSEPSAGVPAGADSQTLATPSFRDATSTSGVDFVHSAGDTGDWILTEIMGAGGALFDANGDGHLDLLLLQGPTDSADHESPQAAGGHRLYLGRGDATFRDAAAAAGFGGLLGYAMGAAVGDVNGDGHLDVFITQLGADALLLGDGSGAFEDVTAAWGIDVDGWSTSAAMADVDADGDLDIYIARYIELNPRLVCNDSAGRRTYCPPASGDAVADVLLRNDGGRFTDISAEVGLDAAPLPGLGVVIEDLTGDGVADIYVANDGQANQLWVRAADGTWRDEGGMRGAALNQNGAPEASMGVVAEDFDGDGLADIFMTHLQEETHTLFQARERSGSTTYQDRTGATGLGIATRAFTGFGAAAFDAELDGDLDLAIAQGRVRIGPVLDGCRLTGPFASLAEPNLMLIWDASAASFRPADAPALTAPVQLDRSVMTGDLDGDGDIDLVFTRTGGPPQILLNESVRAGSWLICDPRESEGAATALGARVTLLPSAGGAPAPRQQSRTARASDGYQSSRDPRPHFGLPTAGAADVEVRWVDGTSEVFAKLDAGRTHLLVRGRGESQ